MDSVDDLKAYVVELELENERLRKRTRQLEVADHVANTLNGILDIDPVSLQKLFRVEIPVSKELVEAQDRLGIIVSADGRGNDIITPMILLDTLIGLDDKTGHGFVSMVIGNSDPERILRFQVGEHLV